MKTATLLLTVVCLSPALAEAPPPLRRHILLGSHLRREVHPWSQPRSERGELLPQLDEGERHRATRNGSP